MANHGAMGMQSSVQGQPTVSCACGAGPERTTVIITVCRPLNVGGHCKGGGTVLFVGTCTSNPPQLRVTTVAFYWCIRASNSAPVRHSTVPRHGAVPRHDTVPRSRAAAATPPSGAHEAARRGSNRAATGQQPGTRCQRTDDDASAQAPSHWPPGEWCQRPFSSTRGDLSCIRRRPKMPPMCGGGGCASVATVVWHRVPVRHRVACGRVTQRVCHGRDALDGE